MSWLDEHKQYATVIIRIGLAVVFLWFGIDKFFHTMNWIGWVPGWMRALIPISMFSFMYVQGAIETLIGVLLLVGYKVRFASFLAVAILLGVIAANIGTGQTEVILRDSGLLAASLSLLLTGGDFLSLDCVLKKA